MQFKWLLLSVLLTGCASSTLVAKEAPRKPASSCDRRGIIYKPGPRSDYCVDIRPEDFTYLVDQASKTAHAYIRITDMGMNSCNVTAAFAQKVAMTLPELEKLFSSAPEISIICRPNAQEGGQMEVTAFISGKK